MRCDAKLQTGEQQENPSPEVPKHQPRSHRL